jgi:hypothetical protein
MLTIIRNPLSILAPHLHAGGTGIWDEVISVVGSIIFLAILIHMFFFEDRDDGSADSKKKKADDDNHDQNH